MAAVTRRQYKGAAVQTTTTNALTTVETSCGITSSTGWPSTAAVSYYVVIDPGTSSEEKCTATISGLTLTLVRGQDDTTATTHTSGATIYPIFSADEADEANLFASTMTTRGDLLTMGVGPTVGRLGVGGAGAILKSNGADPAWLALGSNGFVLTSNGTDAVWAVAAATITSSDADLVIAMQVFG